VKLQKDLRAFIELFNAHGVSASEAYRQHLSPICLMHSAAHLQTGDNFPVSFYSTELATAGGAVWGRRRRHQSTADSM